MSDFERYLPIHAIAGVNPGDYLHEGGLDRSVFADEGVHLTGPEIQGDVAQRLDSGKFFRNPLDANGNVVCHALPPLQVVVPDVVHVDEVGVDFDELLGLAGIEVVDDHVSHPDAGPLRVLGGFRDPVLSVFLVLHGADRLGVAVVADDVNVVGKIAVVSSPGKKKQISFTA